MEDKENKVSFVEAITAFVLLGLAIFFVLWGVPDYGLSHLKLLTGIVLWVLFVKFTSTRGEKK